MTGFLLNWVVTSAALIAVVTLLRAVFGRRISARLRYALWLLVLVRLLVPVQLYTAPAETPHVFPEAPVIQTIPNFQRPRAGVERENLPTGEPDLPVQIIPGAGGEASGAPAARKPFDWAAALGWVWLAGSAVTAAVLLWSNLRFARRLRRVRVPMPTVDCPLIVYWAPGLPSPCLFGVLRPAVYVTPEAAEAPEMLRHVLAHEGTHFRHGDHIWSLLRCAALAVHWWNPLVWLAAILSRRDAELACDEGALRRLGDGERRTYGSTLLALVTAKPRPGDLLRCATTMVGDKRSLRERISRVARTPKRWLWAAVLAVVLSGLVCACSFAKMEETPEDRPLTQEELDHFNNEVFNGEGMNILNQFVYLAVQAPKDYRQIDLASIFYNGTGTFEPYTEEERRAVAEAGYGGEDPGVDLIKCPASQMDEILQTYLGLTLEETDKWGLSNFTYLEEYDAYYDFHGDTNYLPNVTFTSGEYKDGKLLLYYEGEGYPVLSDPEGQVVYWDGFKQVCLTLEPQKDGGFHFLSNWECDPPAQPTAYPDWDPELVIPLDGLTPYEPEAVTVERHTGDVAEQLYRLRFEPQEESTAGYNVEIYRSTDGNAYAAVAASETERDCFLTVSAEDSDNWPREAIATPFENLFGHYGVEITYYGWLDERYYGAFTDYYTFTDDGTPSLLLRAKGETAAIDLDGDGVKELTVSGGPCPQLFFLRDGQLYLADIDALVHEAWPEAGYTEYGWWDEDTSYISFSAQVPIPGPDDTTTAAAFRSMWFDGENLRIYKDNDPYTNHLAQGLDALSADVVAAAREFVQGQFESLAADGYGTDGSGDYNEENFGPGNVTWDDWRITGLSGPYYETAGPLNIEIWNVSYETHTTTPDRVMLAGGSYLGEDGWCMIGYPGCDYLYFRAEVRSRTYLYSTMENDCAPGTELFLSDMVNALMDMELLKLSDLSGEELAKIMWPQSAQFLNDLAEKDGAERDKVLLALGRYFLQSEDLEEYTGFAEELNPGGYRADELTDGGRAAWEQLRGFVDWFIPDAEDSAARAQAMLEGEGRVSEMTLPELLEYASKSDGASAESSFTQLHQRFLADPAAVLSAMAEREDSLSLAYMLGLTIWRDEDIFPGAIEQAQALKGLDEDQAAVRERIVSTYETKKQEA